MPPSVFVTDYSAIIQQGDISEYGVKEIKADVIVNWDPVVNDLRRSRSNLGVSEELERYHSRFALSGRNLLLAEVEKQKRQIESQENLLIDLTNQISPRLIPYHIELLKWFKRNLVYDTDHITNYVKTHADRSIVPRTKPYPAVKWRDLTWADFETLFQMVHDTVDAIIEHGIGKDVDMSLDSQMVGRGIRARSAEIPSIKRNYTLTFDRSREVTFTPMLSAWFAFIPYDKQKERYSIIKRCGEKLLHGVELVLPPDRGGQAWVDMHDPDLEFRSFDGKNWESVSGLLTDCWWGSVWNGYPKLASGISMTYDISTLASIGRAWLAIKRHELNGNIKKMCIHGDDINVLGTDLSMKPLDSTIEEDLVASKYRNMLGWLMLEHGNFTFPGLYRITVDRAPKGESFTMKEMGVIKVQLNQKGYDTLTRKVLFEIFGTGKIKDIPIVEVLAKLDTDAMHGYYNSTRERMEALNKAADRCLA
jgi:hypothetical protein